MTVVCDDSGCVDIAQPKYHVHRLLDFYIIVGRGMLVPVGSEREAEIVITELETGVVYSS